MAGQADLKTEEAPRRKGGPKPGNWKRLFDGEVYFIAAEGSDLLKIGYSNNLQDRLRKLQTSSPLELRLIGSVRGSFLNEQEWHARFAEHRVRGEWFRVTPEMTAAISEAITPLPLIGDPQS